ncbi:TolC family protein [Hufsiella ginkgonis]|uniref:TolC family protein n=1 Tax=Hufsiella ginkgonis TaxID=2695274 RepID=A0A7K1XXI1_9SPHI|nr:TolC family protein [Hufsiella ginkgonis]MXV15226.1 TolC family protein [Hufsiella ginkgonis]
MINRKKYFRAGPARLLLLLLIGLGSAAFAQDSLKTSPVSWDLDACLRYARENNIRLNNLRLTRQISEQELLLAKSAVLPDLYGSASQSLDYSGRRTNGSAIGVSGAYGVNSNWTLYRGGFLRTDIRQKDLLLQSSELNVQAGENDITLQITQAYLNILVDKESVIYAGDLVNTSTAQLEQARRRFEAGSVARKDVAQFEAQLANDRYMLTTSQNAERQDKLTLKQILQLPTEYTFDVVKPDTILAAAAVPPVRQVQQFALNNRPEVKSSELGVQVSELGLRKAQTGYLPSISVGAGLGTSYANGTGFGAFRQFDRNFSQSLGINLSVPLFTKRLNKTNVAEAKITIEQATLSLKDTKTTLSQAVEQSYLNVINAGDQFNAAAEQLKYTREVYRIASEELRLGAANIVDFYQQRNLYIQAMQRYIQAKYNAALSTKIYEFYSGVPVKL